jgi:hypothetical protein
MLPRQPLRFLLADDPGAGKTIMAGLLIKELLIRGDLHRCMIVLRHSREMTQVICAALHITWVTFGERRGDRLPRQSRRAVAG